jgi:hypothetical protein
MYEQDFNTAFSGIGTVGIIIWLAVAGFMIYCLWKIFEKAGYPGWASIIPIYNSIVMLQIAQKPIWWIFLFFIPFVNIIIAILVYIDFAKAFGAGTGFAIGMVFLPIIFMPILALGNYQYQPQY